MVPLSPEKNEALNGFERERSNRADKRKAMDERKKKMKITDELSVIQSRLKRDSESCCYAIEQHWKGNGGYLLLLLSNSACSKLFDEACSVRMSAYTLDQTKTYAYLSDMGTIKSSAAYPVDKPSDFAIQPKKNRGKARKH